MYNENNNHINIPDDFEAKIYITLHHGLSHLNELEAKSHYENYGFNENRIYKYSQVNLNFNVYIYCCGKSGSSTLNATFIKNGYNSSHLHSKQCWTDDCIGGKINPNIFEVIEESMKNNENVYIIDSYRLPIERKISSFFQNFKDPNKDIDYITNQIDQKIYTLENYVSINEVLDYFDIPRFTTFDFEKKYNLIQHKNVTIIKLRFEDIDEWGTILSSIFNKDIKMYDANISENKAYYNEYKIIKNEYHIPDFMIDVIKNDTEFKIYNTLEAQQKYIVYWTTRCKPTINENI